MLAAGKKKTHKAYVWAYWTTSFSDLKAVVYNFAPTRVGEHARNFLGDWQGKLVCDNYSGYKANFSSGITGIGCMANARRKFYDLYQANQSTPKKPTWGKPKLRANDYTQVLSSSALPPTTQF